MEELLRTAFTVGQQWVHDMYNDKEVVSFNEWYNSDEVQQQLKILNIPVVSQQRELLAKYSEWLSHRNLNDDSMNPEDWADVYLANGG